MADGAEVWRKISSARNGGNPVPDSRAGSGKPSCSSFVFLSLDKYEQGAFGLLRLVDGFEAGVGRGFGNDLPLGRSDL